MNYKNPQAIKIIPIPTFENLVEAFKLSNPPESIQLLTNLYQLAALISSEDIELNTGWNLFLGCFVESLASDWISEFIAQVSPL